MEVNIQDSPSNVVTVKPSTAKAATKEEIKGIKSDVAKVSSKGKKQDKELEKLKSGGKKQDKELEKLKEGLDALKKKGAKKKQLSEYNLFVKRQLKEGKTFLQAVSLWKKQQKNLKKLNNPKSKKKSVPVKKTKKQVKPKVSKKLLKHLKNERSVVHFHKESPDSSLLLGALKDSKREVMFAEEKIDLLADKIKKLEQSFNFTSPKGNSVFLKDMVSSMANADESSDESTAVRLAGLYFREVARLGFKRSLELDDVISAYFYSLARLKRRDSESKQILDSMKKTSDGGMHT